MLTNRRINFTDRRELPVDLRQKILNGVLYIEPVQKATDSGTYTCNARNKQGQSARRSGEVFVIGMNFLKCLLLAFYVKIGYSNSIMKKIMYKMRLF